MVAANAAEIAVGIVQERHRLNVVSSDTERELFAVARDRHVEGARLSDIAAVRSQHWAHAAAIEDFCRLVGHELPDAGVDAVEMYRNARRELEEHVADNTLGVKMKLELGQSYRLRAKFDEERRDVLLEEAFAEAEAVRKETFFWGTGAEPLRGNFELLLAAVMFEKGQGAQIDVALAESVWHEKQYERWTSRGHYKAALALGSLVTGDEESAADHLRAAVAAYATKDSSPLGVLGPNHEASPRRVVRMIGVMLALAELQAFHLDGVDPAIRYIRESLDDLEHVRARWRVINRSRSPLAIAFRRVYGDIALLLAGISHPKSGELGFRVALSAKQSGFAALIRTNRSLLGDRAQDVLREIIDLERRSDQLFIEGRPGLEWHRLQDELRNQRVELDRHCSSLLVDMAVPEAPDIAEIRRRAGNRYVLDYVALPNSLTDDVRMFRSAAEPGGAIDFGIVERIRYIETSDFARCPSTDWAALGRDLLPGSLLTKLREVGADRPLQLLVSPYAELTQFPWAALVLDDSGTRLIERSVISQTPTLTCLADSPVAPVTGPALVRLVFADLWVRDELYAWRLPTPERRRGLFSPPPERVAMWRCELESRVRVRVKGTLDEVLQPGERNDYGLVHVAAHANDETGFKQAIQAPEALSAAHAMRLRWPKSVILAACHVGRISNLPEAEPYGYVVALLASNAQCVVAGLDAVPDAPTGKLIGDVVSLLQQDRRLDLPTALALAQRRAAARETTDETVLDWALLGAFVR